MMSDEERQRQLDTLLEQQAALAVKLDLMLESRQRDEEARAREEAAQERAHARAVGRIDRLERVAKLMVRAGLRAQRGMREQDSRISTLVDSQLHTEEIARLNNEAIGKLSESTRQNTAALNEVREIAHRNSATVGELAEATRRNSAAIGQLAEIVRGLAERRNGNGGGSGAS